MSEQHAATLAMLADLKRRMADDPSTAGADALQIEALEAGAAALRRSLWQPIASAPQDGAWFLGGWHHRRYGWCWDRCRWADDAEHKDGGYFYGGSGGIPTHWLKLPPPPEAP